jgi:hypothetical protein
MSRRKREREKHCQRCETPYPVLFRIRVDEAEGWIFCCEACLHREQARHPNTYTYGGTWKARKAG